MARRIGPVAIAAAIGIVLWTTPALAAAGDLDTAFSGDGKVTTLIGSTASGAALAIQPNGRIVAAGGAEQANGNGGFALARYNTHGSLDRTFGDDGKIITRVGGTATASAAGVAIQSNGKIVAAGLAHVNHRKRIALVRYKPDGSLDKRFGVDGKVTTLMGTGAHATSVAIQTDGKIVVAAEARVRRHIRIAVARYNHDGSLDRSFSGNGKLSTLIGLSSVALAVVVQSDGKIVVAGVTYVKITESGFAPARYNSDGSLDRTFGDNGKLITLDTTDGEAHALAIQSDGKIVAAGLDVDMNSFALARYNSDGSLDTTFSGDGIQTTHIGGLPSAAGVAIQPDGKIVAAGFTFVRSNERFALARYNSDGSLDTTFNGDGKVTTRIDHGDASVSGVAIQSNGKIVVAGVVAKSCCGKENRFALARYLGS